ncbi:MAG: hypothetical protein R2855_03100 [Thermomicrobiales bacterium]
MIVSAEGMGIDPLLRELSTAIDPDERKAILAQIETQILTGAASIPRHP